MKAKITIELPINCYRCDLSFLDESGNEDELYCAPLDLKVSDYRYSRCEKCRLEVIDE